MNDFMGGLREFFSNLFGPPDTPQQSQPDYADAAFSDYPSGTNPWNNWDPSTEDFWAQVRSNQAPAPAIPSVNAAARRMVGPRAVESPRAPIDPNSLPSDPKAPQPVGVLGPVDAMRVTSALPGPISKDANAATPASFGDPGSNLAQLKTKSGATITVNSKVSGNFAGFIDELEGMGYRIDPQQTGGYANRLSRGSSRLSQHAFGNAVDLNWNLNTYKGGGKNNLPDNVAEIAKRHGLTWGGLWKNRDTMHFEWHPVHGVPARVR